SAVGDQIRTLEIDEFLTNWLKELITVEFAFQSLFPEDRIQQIFDKGTVLHLPLPSLSMENLYRKAHRLQKEVLKNPTITHIGLLSQLEPYVAKSYRKVLTQELTLKNRFCMVTKDLYQRGDTSVAISSINTKAILKILEVDTYEFIADRNK